MRRAWLPLTVSGLLGIGLGAVVDPHRIVYGWFVAGVFYLSVCLGTTFLVIVHHLFDAVWMVTLRRFCEHAACLVFPWLAIVFFPLAVLPGCGGNAGGFGRVFRSDAGFGAGLHDRIEPLVSIGVLAVVFASWSWLAYKLRSLSLAQDNTGDPSLKCCLRRYSVGGAIVLAVTITAATGLWLRWVSPVWMSSIYAACFLTSCAWFAVAVIWLLAIAIGRAAAPGRIGGALQMRSIGAMLLAFTLLHGYMHYSQYFVVWNANLPAETWWYI
ncbi:MAG: hypothetical protein N3G20_00260, partial [Verrucomicrobiae bacterium]|nr:hypothetical protein [Verrucomicrobiae bacterium]